MNLSASAQPDPHVSMSSSESHFLAVSALMDGESDTSEWSHAWANGAVGSEECQATWHCYHVIGDVLRAGASGETWNSAGSCVSTHESTEFARRVTQLAQARGALTQVPAPAVSSVSPSARQHAANEGVFRWKMASGAAACVAVLAVSWGLAGVGLGGREGVLAAAPVAPLSQTKVAAAVSVVAQAEPVWVNTPQGKVLRDARLEELMQTHRQLGGASALQVPAGFLRTATMDANQR